MLLADVMEHREKNGCSDSNHHEHSRDRQRRPEQDSLEAVQLKSSNRHRNTLISIDKDKTEGHIQP